MQVIVCHSIDPSTPEAVEEIVADFRARLGGHRPVAAIVFAAIQHDHEVALAGLREALGHIPLVGCSTDGELSTTLGFAEDSIVLAVFCGEGFSARVLVAEGLSGGVEAAVEAAVHKLGDIGQPAACLLLADSLTADAVAVVGALSVRLPPGVPMFGGTAGDQRRMQSTKQFAGTRVLSDAAVVLLLDGAVCVGVGVHSGWAPLGARGTVTRSIANIVYEIDGAPATEFYRKYFGQNVELSPDHPLAVGDATSWILRAPLGPGDQPGSIFFAGAVAEGTEVQITAASRDEILQACDRSTTQALGAYIGGPPEGAMIISCAARRQLLGTRTGEEATAVRRTLGDLPAFGFYSYGEIGSHAGSAVVDFHNETFVTVLFGSP
jgi:hypothetical protein